MNRWYQIRRLRGAVILILIGVLALMNQWHVMRWEVSWPFILIVLGLVLLAERVAWAADARARQEEQEYVASGGAYNPSPPPGTAGSASWPPASESSSVESDPFIQSHPPTPEEPGREGR
jgi:hypothetical protein